MTLRYVYEVDSDFSDHLGGNFSSKSNAGSRTLKSDMRAESDINNALDPDRAKVDACTYTCMLIFLCVHTLVSLLLAGTKFSDFQNS